EGYPLFLISQATPSAGPGAPPGGIWTNGYWFWPQTLYAYHKSVQVFRCPSSSSTSRTSGHYAANRLIMLSSSDPRPPVKLSAIQSAADKYLIMDGSYIAMTPGEIANAQ